MTIFMTGSLVVDRPISPSIQQYISENYGDEWFVYEDSARKICLDFQCGDYGDDLEGIIKYLEKNGYHVDEDETGFTYTGDYDGGYLYEDGELESFDQEEYILRTLPTSYLLSELNRRNTKKVK